MISYGAASAQYKSPHIPVVAAPQVDSPILRSASAQRERQLRIVQTVQHPIHLRKQSARKHARLTSCAILELRIPLLYTPRTPRAQTA